MIYEASYRRKALQQWQVEQAEAEQELIRATSSLAEGLHKFALALLAPLLSWWGRP